MEVEPTGGIEPIFITVKQAAQALALSPGTVYELCYSGDIASRMRGTRRLVSVASVREYAAALPEGAPESETA